MAAVPATGSAGARRAAMTNPALGTPEWYDKLIFGPKDKILRLSANINTILRHHPAFAGTFGMDKLRNCTVIRRPLPWDYNGHTAPRDWSENDDRLLAEWLQHNPKIFVEARFVGSCVETIAHENAFHPVMDYFQGITWDGEHRADEWAIKYLGVPDTPYVRAVSAKWLISAAARIEEPGCKADCVLVLEGVEDLGKSTVFRKLAVNRRWFTDEISALGTKDAAEQLRGIWIAELAELDALTRAADVAAAKAAISRLTDRYRPPYGFRVQEFERQCVFGATSNRSDWNRDDTGGRRFWPLVCHGDIRIDELEAVRDQLWAEAHDRYLAQELWYLDKSNDKARIVLQDARDEQAKRHETDAWESIVLSYVDPEARPSVRDNGVLISDILTSPAGLDIKKGDIRRDQQMRVSRILATNRWTREQRMNSGVREWRWFPPPKDPDKSA
jgi:putative DNA primase/helicase